MGKLVWVFGVIFTLVGVGMLVGSGWTMGTTLKFRKSAQTTEGQIVSYDTEVSESRSNGRTKRTTMYRAIYEYRDLSGTTHQAKASSSSSSKGYAVGAKVPVRFMPNNPDDARIDSFMENWFAPLILGGLGIVFFGIGVGSFVAGITKARNRKWLKANGMRVQAKFTGAIYDTSLKVNGRSPYRVTAQWQHPVANTMHSFKSDAIWYDPTELLANTEVVDVLVNADNPKVYEVDISFLPKEA
jgi:hypothetical protein